MKAEKNLMQQRRLELLLATLQLQGLLDATEGQLARHRACAFGLTTAGTGVTYYPRSFYTSGGSLFFLGRMSGPGEQGMGSRRLFIISKDKPEGQFNGSRHSIGGRQILEAEPSYENYLAAAEHLPFIRPSSLRDKTTTIGCGDRLGASNPGHIRAARSFAVSPVLAQQSIRELTLTGRTYQIGRAHV